jgi:hypothetical protein
MNLTMISGVAICLAAAPAFAAQQVQNHTWSGFLVKSSCYEALERNTDPWDTSTYVDRDRDWEVRYCSPDVKTKSFTLVDHDGLSHKLDPAGNTRAADAVRQTGKKVPMEVKVAGQQDKDTIQVDSISPVK